MDDKKKRGTFRRSAELYACDSVAKNTNIAECAVQYIHGHTECKNFLQYVYFEFAVQSSTFTISLPKFFIVGLVYKNSNV